MLGQRPSNDEGVSAQHGLSPLTFFFHYPALQPFLLGELRGAARDLQGPQTEAKLHLQPSLFPVLTLLAQLQPGVQDSTKWLLFIYLYTVKSGYVLFLILYTRGFSSRLYKTFFEVSFFCVLR